MGSPAIFSGRRTKLLTADGLLTSAGRPLDYNGAIDYLTNGTGEINAANWSVYNDGSVAAPVDGTGGTNTNGVTITRSTSSPLRGQAHLLLTKPASDCKGYGISIPFTCDAQDAYSILAAPIEYKIASGTYADGDAAWYVVDATNTVVIQPTPFSKLNSALPNVMQPTFQGTGATSYRLCLHIVSTSASAYTIAFRAKCGPQIKSYGPYISDWQSFTPTSTWVSNTTHTGYYRRVGDTMEIQANLALSGAPTSATLTVNLPSGHTIDTAKISIASASTPLGIAAIFDDSAGVQYPGRVIYSTTTAVLIGVDNSSEQLSAVTQAVPMTFANLDAVRITFRVPIVGWSSGQLLSSDADTRVVAMQAIKNAGSQTSSGSYQDVAAWTTTNSDTHAAFNATTGVYTVPVAGYYDIIGQITFTANTTGARLVKVQRNGANIFYGTGGQADQVTVSMHPFSGGYYFNAGDTIKILAYQTSGGSLAYDTSDVNTTSLYISRRSGPSQIAASESVYFEANTSTTAATTSAPFIFTVAASNSHGVYSTSTGVFTAPCAGFFHFDASVYMGATSTNLNLYKNGAQWKAAAVPNVSGTSGSSVSAGGRLLTGDTVECRPTGNATSSGIAATTFFSGFKVGN